MMWFDGKMRADWVITSSSSKPETGNIEIFTQDFPWKRSVHFLPVPLFYKSWGWLWPICAFLLRVWLVVAIAPWPHRRFCWQPWDKKIILELIQKAKAKHCRIIAIALSAHMVHNKKIDCTINARHIFR